MDLEQLWDRMKFDASALQRGQRRYYVPYALDDGPGDTFGIRLRKFGRYANNLFSAANAIELARKLGWRWVQLCDIDFLGSFETLEIDGVTLLHPNARPPEGVRFLTGPYFRRADFGDRIAHLDRRDILRIISASVLPALQIPMADVPDDQLVIHIRSGDVFKVRPHPNYAQPPLSFYTRVIEELRAAGEINSVCLVFENTRNPCIAGLCDYLDRTGMPYRTQSGTFAEDGAVIFGARRVAFGVGTFALGMAATSTRLRDVYAFRQKDLDAFSAHEQVWLVDAGDDYIPRNGWTNSPEQLATMISYPAEKLEVRKLVRAV